MLSLASGQFLPFHERNGPPKDNLMCPTFCQSNHYIDRCCACDSQPTWVVNKSVPIRNIYVEYISVVNSAIIVNVTDRTPSSFDSVVHISGRLEYFPENVCDFPHLVTVDFSENRIHHISNISCLSQIDSLKLKGNKLKFILNTTFINLNNLRVLDVSHNLIRGMDPNVFNLANIHIYKMDFSENIFDTFDITNIIPENPLYCEMNFNHSIFGKFTNKQNYRLNPNTTYGSGKVLLSYNTFPDIPINVLMEHHPEDYPLISKVFQHGKFVMDQTPIVCDCHMGLLLTLYKVISDIEKRFIANQNISNDFCQAPPAMTNYSLFSVINDRSLLHKLVCDVKVRCPKGCNCTEQPSKNRLKVDCQSSNLASLPKVMPESFLPIQLYLANNSISHLEDRDYLKHVSFIDLSNNPVTTLTKAAVGSLGTSTHVLFKEHKLEGLPDTIRLLDPDQFEFGEASIPCDCENTWIGDWKRYKGDNLSINPLWCQTPKGVVAAHIVTEEFLQCNGTVNPTLVSILGSITGFAVFTIISVLIAVNFKFEILLLKRQMVGAKKPRSWIHDIYLSFDDENDDVRLFVLNILRPFLLEKEYKVYTPCLDTAAGKRKRTEIQHVLFPVCSCRSSREQ
ncbi:Slit-like 3 protein [Mizuhopecten yessoensis]|uniref:Slit-like 3 protein n=1 Tax=Mizuhopecten yessoensis TaxID=6573 RepID=A0A210PR99_MIZYE|nr:Slit-like 3 protein [Mizuhopecten yessoensis]